PPTLLSFPTRRSSDLQEHRQQQLYSEHMETLRQDRGQMLNEVAKILEEKQDLLRQLERESQEHAQTLEHLPELEGERQSLLEQRSEEHTSELQSRFDL